MPAEPVINHKHIHTSKTALHWRQKRKLFKFMPGSKKKKKENEVKSEDGRNVCQMKFVEILCKPQQIVIKSGNTYTHANRTWP